MNESGEIVGMVDVLKLTYATLEQVSWSSMRHHEANTDLKTQINTMQTQDDEGPAWNKFWLSMDHESDSMVSGSQSQQPHTPHRSVMSPDLTRSGYDNSVLPNESASHHGGEEHSEVASQHHHAEDAPFPFKFKAPSGRVHRVNVLTADGITNLVSQVTAKLGAELEAVGGEAVVQEGRLSNTGYALSYMDNEGDTVSITTDQDMLDAITLARRARRDKVDLFVHDPTEPPIPATVEPQPAKPATPAEEPSSATGDHASEEALLNKPRPQQSFPSHAPEEQFISGVPNELLLPGAIVTLAAVIAGVFILSRPSGR